MSTPGWMNLDQVSNDALGKTQIVSSSDTPQLTFLRHTVQCFPGTALGGIFTTTKENLPIKYLSFPVF